MDSLTKIGARNLAATPPVKDSEAAPLNRSMSSWQAGRRSAIADDPKKLNAAVDGMARFLAQALLVKDLTLVDADEGTNVVKRAKDVAREEGRAPTLAKVLNAELRYRPSADELDHIEELSQSYNFALAADDLAIRMLVKCGIAEQGSEDIALDASDADQEGVDLTIFATDAPYFEREAHQRLEGDAIVLGGLGRLLRDEVAALAHGWLWECERALCIVHGETWEPFTALDELVMRVGRDLAKRVTLHTRRVEQALASVDHLSASFLERRGGQEVTRTRAYAQVDALNDLKSLRHLLSISKRGDNTREVRDVLQHQLHVLRRVFEAPPIELGLVGENKSRMNLSLLARVLDEDMPIEVRMRISDHWAKQHGGFAHTRIVDAIRLLESFAAKDASPVFIDVVTTQRGKGGLALPPAPFAPGWVQWYARPAPTEASERSGLDGHGRRIVRLTSMVWAMVAHGAFEQGRLRREVAVPCAIESLYQARLMRELVDHERKRCELGARITSFVDEIENLTSDVSHAVGVAACELSPFSLADIYETFNPERALLGRLLNALSTRTRALLGNECSALVPTEYEHFARDALAVLLPAVAQRRLRIGLPISAAPHPLADMLRTCRELRTWTPLEGRFKLEARALRACHPRLREALENWHYVQRDLVKANHLGSNPYGARTRRAVCFTFESGPLLQLLRM